MRRIAVSVTWQFPGQSAPRPRGRRFARTSSVSAAPAGLTMTYQMTVVRQHGTWYVAGIGPST
jgi:hypothetical protein